MDVEPEDREASREAARWMVVAFLAHPLIAWGFVTRFERPVADGIFLAAILVLLPILAVAQVSVISGRKVDRATAYATSAGTTLVLGTVAVVLGVRALGIDGFGLGAVHPLVFVGWTVGITVAAGALFVVVYAVRRKLGLDESSILTELLPRNAPERSLFVLVSLLAGFGEEAAFRGYAIPALAPLLGGVWPAAGFTSVVFGLLHAYQGMLGMVRAALLGMLMACALILTGSLWPAMCAHAAIDLLGGLAWGRRLLR